MWKNVGLFGEIFNHITDILDLLQERKIVIFGGGKAGKITGFILNSFNITNYYYVDNSEVKWNTKILGKKVYPASQLLNEDKESLIILIGSMYFDSIAKQLECCGFTNKVNFFRVLFNEDALQDQISPLQGISKEITRISHIQRSINLISTKIDSSMSIIDVGAYKGEPGDSTPLYAVAFPNNTIYAFEPLQDSYQTLVENTQKYNNVISVHGALSNKNEDGVINITSVSHSSSLLEINQKKVNDLKNEYMNILKFSKTENVKVMTFDEFANKNNLDKIAILKIDTQGSEHLVLEGAAESLKRTIIIVLEMSNNETYVNAPKYFKIDAYLRENGFLLHDLIPSLYEKGKLYEYDAIYVNKNYAEYINDTEKYDDVMVY